jgi:ribokinase
MKRPTIREVARRAGVSVGTVSNVINGRVRVAEHTRAAVNQAVIELGFTANTFARSLPVQWGRKIQPAERNRAPRLTAAGYISVDYTARIGVLPHRDDRITAAGIDKSLGGPATNVAVMAAGLGGRWTIDCELMTVLGEDVDSDWALAELTSKRVSTAGVRRRQNGRLSRCIVLVEPAGNRTIINEPFTLDCGEVEAHLGRTHSPGRSHCLHLEGYQVDALAAAVAAHRDRGGIASVHATGIPAAWRTREGFLTLAKRFDVLFLHREAAREIVGFRGPDMALARRISHLYSTLAEGETCRLVVLTLGSLGAAVLERGTAYLVPAPHVDPIDTTGAGDTFVGVFLAAWLNAATAVEAARLATVAASLSTLSNGAQGVQFSADEIDGRADSLEYPDDTRATLGAPRSITALDLLAGAA